MASQTKNEFINRELSWLEFNDRVLQCAQNGSLPLLERLKFLAITGSNLDEFFMVRVGGLQLLSKKNNSKKDPAGMRPTEQLDAIFKRATRMAEDQYACFSELEKQLALSGIVRVLPHELSGEQSRHAEYVFENEIAPVLSPMTIAGSEQTPLLANRMLYIAVRLSSPDGPYGTKTGKPLGARLRRLTVIPIGKTPGRFITLPSEGGYHYMLIEDLVVLFASRFFPGEAIAEAACFRVTRNADVSVQEDDAHDLLSAMEDVIDARKRGDCVRLEIDGRATPAMLSALASFLYTPDNGVYRAQGPLDLSAFMQLTGLSGYDKLRYKPWPPKTPPLLKSALSMFEVISKRDILLYHPYESFDPVLRFVQEAAKDPMVVALKQTLYRTSKKSPIVAALADAARAGKYVTAIVELKARFDEERNIEWATELEDAGVQVIYGVKGLKTHAKVFIAVRREPNGLKRYLHFGTGNYNEITATIYSDASFMTCDEDLGADASAFFNSITGNSQPQKYRKIESAPLGLRQRVVSLIEAETERCRQGQKAFIRAKMNSITHPEIIKALYAASQAGVKILLNVRGICCLRPGVKGLSETISIKSIVGRFLEHARIWCFHNGGREKVFICTADWMQRNLDKRVELLTPVEDKDAKARLIHILDLCFKDTVNSWQLLPDGAWQRLGDKRGNKKELKNPAPSGGVSSLPKEKIFVIRPLTPLQVVGNARAVAFNCQAALYDEACEKSDKAKRMKRTMFEAQKPAKARK